MYQCKVRNEQRIIFVSMISMRQTAEYFVSFPAVDVKIENKNKRGRKL